MKPSVVLVANPPTRLFSVNYPLGIGYIAAVLKQHNYNVRILDFSNNICSINRSVKEISKAGPDFIGFSVFSYNYNLVKKMINLLKIAVPNAKIIIGGPHVSALPGESLEDMGADFSIVGEAEYVMPEIIKRIVSGINSFDDMGGVAFWKNNVPVINSGCNIVDNLNDLPFPAWGLLSPVEYEDVAALTFFKDKPIGPILTSRGCPHRCSFCASYIVHGRGVRERCAKNIVDEIESLVKFYKVKEINFYDDTFSENINHALEFCREIKDRKLKISWRTAVGMRLNTLNEELLDAFEETGCYLLGFGVESIVDSVLKGAKKPLLKSINKRIRMIKQRNIFTMGYFIIGLPDDTEDSIKRTIEFARKSEIDFLSFTYAVPLPGTDIFKQKYKAVHLNKTNWDNFNFFTKSPFTLSKVPVLKLKYFLLSAYCSSYFSPRRMMVFLTTLFKFKRVRVAKMIRIIHFIIKNLF